jgi:hypothetical protein
VKVVLGGAEGGRRRSSNYLRPLLIRPSDVPYPSDVPSYVELKHGVRGCSALCPVSQFTPHSESGLTHVSDKRSRQRVDAGRRGWRVRWDAVNRTVHRPGHRFIKMPSGVRLVDVCVRAIKTRGALNYRNL